MLSNCFYVDTREKNVIVNQMTKEENSLYKEVSKINPAWKYDIMAFSKIEKAMIFRRNFQAVLNDLRKEELKSIPKMPKLLMKRRYIILAILGHKNLTTRHFKKDWKIGSLFQIYDQTYFLTVKLTKLKEVKINNETFYEYHYKTINE